MRSERETQMEKVEAIISKTDNIGNTRYSKQYKTALESRKRKHNKREKMTTKQEGEMRIRGKQTKEDKRKKRDKKIRKQDSKGHK